MDAETEHGWASCAITQSGFVRILSIHGPRQVTDAYLLALATVYDGRFVTFDRSVALSAVHGAAEENLTVL